MGKKFDDAVLKLNHDVSQETQFRIQLRTPVDTGLLQSSFQIENVTKDGFVITNDAPYVMYVEEGTPHTPPAHMVRATFAEFQEIVDLCVRRQE